MRLYFNHVYKGNVTCNAQPITCLINVPKTNHAFLTFLAVYNSQSLNKIACQIRILLSGRSPFDSPLTSWDPHKRTAIILTFHVRSRKYKTC